tara:strand:- start:1086 stop:1343 length:258 start_codon:yes stop_codon:yes gene_type:complete
MRDCEEYIYNIPTWALIYIEYGEADGLSVEEIDDVDAFIESLPNGRGGRVLCFDCSDSPSFMRTNDINSLGAECVKGVLTVFNTH